MCSRSLGEFMFDCSAEFGPLWKFRPSLDGQTGAQWSLERLELWVWNLLLSGDQGGTLGQAEICLCREVSAQLSADARSASRNTLGPSEAQSWTLAVG